MERRDVDRQEINLIMRAQAGNIDAFEELMRLHDRRILQLICSIVGNLHDAYDVHQETFIRAYNKLATFRFESALSTWLSKIAINLSLNWLKRQKRRQWFSFGSENESQVSWEIEPETADGIEETMLSQELRQQIEQGLQQLPDQQRTVFVLKHFQGYKIKEIAEMMGSADGTIKNHLFRATHRLQKILQPYYNVEG